MSYLNEELESEREFLAYLGLVGPGVEVTLKVSAAEYAELNDETKNQYAIIEVDGVRVKGPDESKS